MARVEGQIEQLVSAVDGFTKASEHWREGVSKDIKALSSRIADSTRPNAAWAGVVISFIMAVATPVAFFVIREMNRSEANIVALDVKLQREQQLIEQKLTQEVANVDRASRERHESAKVLIDMDRDRLIRLEHWQDEWLQAELQELRQRRQK